jgi:hypothetical protein
MLMLWDNLFKGAPAGRGGIFYPTRTVVGTARKLPITDMNMLNARLVLPR